MNTWPVIPEYDFANIHLPLMREPVGAIAVMFLLV
jgi:hypothetical protein